MIKEKEILVNMSYRNITFYKNKGYECKLHESIFIKVEDLNTNSHIKITAVCEKCGNEISLMLYKYYKNFDNHNYYSCKKCSRLKMKLTCLEKYNVENTSQLESVRIKTENTCLEKFGFKTNLLCKETIDKIKETNNKLYDSDWYVGTKKCQEQAKQYMLDKYNVSRYTNTKEFKKYIKERFDNEIIEKLKEYNITDYTLNEDRTVNIKCDLNKEHYYTINSKNIYQRYHIQKTICCTICNPIDQTKSSSGEKYINDIIENNYNKNILCNSRKIINPFELDIYLPDINFAIEYNGCYWHSIVYKDKMDHYNKYLYSLTKNINLIQIWEYQKFNKLKVVESLILNKLNKSNRIYARKTKIQLLDINTSNQFIKENSLYDNLNNDINICLKYNEEIVYLISLNKKENNYIITNIVNKLNTIVVGGFSKILKYINSNYNFEYLETEHDLSLGNTKLYLDNNFKFIKFIEPEIFIVEDKTYNLIDTDNNKCLKIFDVGKELYRFFK